MSFDFDAVIVGGGFSGVLALHRLRQSGFRCRGIEKASDLGGVWHSNRYPGARADSPQPHYQFFDEELLEGWQWSETFPAQPEIKEYFDHVDRRWEIKKDYDFSVAVEKAAFEPAGHFWTVHLSNGKRLSTRWFILAIGQLSHAVTPTVKGMSSFQGQMSHSGNWPGHHVDWHDKRVSIVGTGASAVQIIQELAPKVKQLNVLQRSEMVGFPKMEASLPAADGRGKVAFTDPAYAKHVFKTSKMYHSGFPYTFRAEKMISLSDDEVRFHHATILAKGNWSYLLSAFKESVHDPDSNTQMYAYWAEQMREKILDPELKDSLIPLVPSSPIGMKRPCLVSDYYETFNRENVQLVNLRTEPMIEITETGITTEKSHYQSDYIIWATGFESRTACYAEIDIHGTEDLNLASVWGTSIRSNLGMTVNGFPNMFYVYGPQSATVRVNGPTVIDEQVKWLCSTLDQLRSMNITWFEPTESAELLWQYKIEKPWLETLYPRTQSWETRKANSKTGEPSW
ncbi:hypothetical protein N7520_002277 [Penicillium odoratum]|uniref:uncharacterized protein n=1 Tax=Penicillium odoratum TaxID=1167516 RepID=UPI00254698C1|nr:uncharacterized protein N7520_002277 [Penicillium odoratum]KAJ5771748.1 hypothetical protein N7520_002277 [Penicillium odoratum]